MNKSRNHHNSYILYTYIAIMTGQRSIDRGRKCDVKGCKIECAYLDDLRKHLKKWHGIIKGHGLPDAHKQLAPGFRNG